jgi:hypothetical protein
MTNELLCKTCGRYLTIGCNCDSSGKKLCELCHIEFDDLDTLENHLVNFHKRQSK